MNNERLEKIDQAELSSSLLTEATVSKPAVHDKPTKLPWGVIKEKTHSIYNKSLLLNLKNKTSYETALILPTESTLTTSDGNVNNKEVPK